MGDRPAAVRKGADVPDHSDLLRVKAFLVITVSTGFVGLAIQIFEIQLVLEDDTIMIRTVVEDCIRSCCHFPDSFEPNLGGGIRWTVIQGGPDHLVVAVRAPDHGLILVDPAF